MVAIRSTHSNDAGTFVLDEWIAQLKLDSATSDELKHAYQYCQSLGNEQTLVEPLWCAREMIEILSLLNMEKETLLAALLFNVVDKNLLSHQLVAEKFGDSIEKLITGVQTMAAIKFLNGNAQATSTQIDNVRHMLLAMVDDFRCVVIKLAERISFLRLIKQRPEQERLAAAKECATIYAPLANRLGIGQLKWELEDYAFFYQYPDTYKQIAKQLAERRIDREQYINEFVASLQQAMAKYQINAEVYGRPKHIYSIWRKMQKKHLAFDELFDVRAVRIIADKLQDCYAALGAVHTQYRHLPKEFDDYVANPKPNGYQSIHTVVLGPGGKPVEIQIRTKQMHDDAELGVAAHWKYKEGASISRSGSSYDEKIAWLRRLLAWQDEMSDSGEMLDELRSQVFDDRVYVFTPKGDVVDLPIGATPLDFAYHIHSEVGHRCIGAKVGGRIVPFTYQLNMGDQVDIITQKEPAPSRDWLNPNLGFVTSGRARAKLNAYFRRQAREKNIQEGKEILLCELGKIGASAKDASLALKRFYLNSLDDLYAGVGNGDLRINQIINFINSQVNKVSKEQEDSELVEKLAHLPSETESSKKAQGGAVVVEGIDNLLTHLARCCQPIPGDLIQGYVTQGRGISVHRAECEQLAELRTHAPERIIDTVWCRRFSGNFAVTIRVTSSERNGLVKDLNQVFTNEKSKILGLQTRVDYKKRVCLLDFTVNLNEVDGLNELLRRLEQVKEVHSAVRLK